MKQNLKFNFNFDICPRGAFYWEEFKLLLTFIPWQTVVDVLEKMLIKEMKMEKLIFDFFIFLFPPTQKSCLFIVPVSKI